jgi:propionyl-CoA carboxylase alpha chain
MRRALQEFRLIGVESSIPFCYTVMNNEDFGSGDFDTHFISHTFPEGFKPAVPTQFLEASVVAAGLFKAGDRQMFNGKTNRDAVKHGSLWKTRGRTSNRPK